MVFNRGFGWAVFAGVLMIASTSAAEWRPHEVRRLGGQEGDLRVPAQLQIVTESWNRVVAVPYIVYLPEKDRVLMLVGCDYPHHAEVLTSDDRGETWSSPRVIWRDDAGSPIPGLGVSLTYLGGGRLLMHAGSSRLFSEDYGETWGSPVPVGPTPDGKPWYTWDPLLVDRHTGKTDVTQLIETGYTWHRPPEAKESHQQAYLRFSTDLGRTWDDGIKVPQWKKVSEVALLRMANGELLAACRTDIPPSKEGEWIDHYEGLGVSFSSDDGRTWSEVAKLYDWGRHHPSPVLLPNGHIVMTYVVRKGYVDTADGFPHFGIEAVVSRDHGRTWDLDHRYILYAWKGNRQGPNKWWASCQATSTVLLPDRSLLTAFGTGYRSEPTEVENHPAPRDVGLIRWRLQESPRTEDHALRDAPFDSDLRNVVDPAPAPEEAERYVLVNWDEECMWVPLVESRTTEEPDAALTQRVIEDIIDEHAAVGVDAIAHCVFGTGFRSHLPSSKITDLLAEFRPPGLDEAGIDYIQLLIDRCRQRGLTFIAGLRMNDRHNIPPGAFVREHPEWRWGGGDTNAMNYAVGEVRQHILDFVSETLDAYDVDGVEYDYMRWCHMFNPGEGPQNAHLLTDLMRKTRRLLDTVAQRRGRERLLFGVRVPQTVEECAHLGFDLRAWIQERLVDYVVPADFFFTDFTMKTEDYVDLTKGTECKVYPQIAPVLCWNGNAREVTAANYRAAVRNFYAYGAHGFSPYNYQVHWQRRRHPSRGWARPVNWPSALGFFRELRDPAAIARGDRHYVYFPLWDRPSPTGFAHDERIVLDRASENPQGTQRFRACEDWADPGLRATFQFKAVGLRENERLEVRLNDAPVPRESITRVFDEDGQAELEGYPLDPFWEYTIDLDWDCAEPPLANGDNALHVRLLPEAPAEGRVVINDPELFVYVRSHRLRGQVSNSPRVLGRGGTGLICEEIT